MRKTRIGIPLFLTILLATLLTLSVSAALAGEVAQVRAAIAEKKAKWQAGETSMTRLSPAERRQRLGLVKPVLAAGAEAMFLANLRVVEDPPSRL